MTPKKTQNPVVRWKWALLESGLPSSARLVLLTLSVHMDDNGRGCFPSLSLLCTETGLAKRTVVYSIQKAAAAGWIKVGKKKTDGNSWPQNDYQISWPPSGATNAPDKARSGATNAPDKELSGATNAPDKELSGANNSMKVVHQLHTNSTGELHIVSTHQESIVPDPVNYTGDEGTGWIVDEAVYDSWLTAYANGRTHRDTEDWIEAELQKARNWLKANPRKRKQNYLQFLNNWLTRASTPRANGIDHARTYRRGFH